MAHPESGQSQLAPPWRWMGERGLRVETGITTLARYKQLTEGLFEEIEDIIAADGSILMILKPGALASPRLYAALMAPVPVHADAIGRRHVLPFRARAEAGPDRALCAATLGLSEAALIEALLATEFTVAFLGFQPGFPYLTGLPPRLMVPRRTTPRVRVPAGSVALGGVYAGIYPEVGPGGWHIVGQTPARLFDPGREPPALMAAGDRVRFEVCP